MNKAEWLASDDPAAILAVVIGTPGESGRSGMEAEPPQPPLLSVSDRRLRLFAVACCRSVWRLLTDAHSRTAVEVAERYADGLVTMMDLSSAADSAWNARKIDDDAACHASYMAACACWENVQTVCDHVIGHARLLNPPAVQAALLREVVGNPFRPVAPLWRLVDTGPPMTWHPHSPWLTHSRGLVVELAKAAYEIRRPCGRCGGIGTYKRIMGLPAACDACHGTGSDGLLDPHAVAVVADALEDAGCNDLAILDHLRSKGPHCRGCWVLDLMLGKE